MRRRATLTSGSGQGGGFSPFTEMYISRLQTKVISFNRTDEDTLNAGQVGTRMENDFVLATDINIVAVFFDGSQYITFYAAGTYRLSPLENYVQVGERINIKNANTTGAKLTSVRYHNGQFFLGWSNGRLQRAILFPTISFTVDKQAELETPITGDAIFQYGLVNGVEWYCFNDLTMTTAGKGELIINGETSRKGGDILMPLLGLHAGVGEQSGAAISIGNNGAYATTGSPQSSGHAYMTGVGHTGNFLRYASIYNGRALGTYAGQKFLFSKFNYRNNSLYSGHYYGGVCKNTLDKNLSTTFTKENAPNDVFIPESDNYNRRAIAAALYPELGEQGKIVVSHSANTAATSSSFLYDCETGEKLSAANFIRASDVQFIYSMWSTSLWVDYGILYVRTVRPFVNPNEE